GNLTGAPRSKCMTRSLPKPGSRSLWAALAGHGNGCLRVSRCPAISLKVNRLSRVQVEVQTTLCRCSLRHRVGYRSNGVVESSRPRGPSVLPRQPIPFRPRGELPAPARLGSVPPFAKTGCSSRSNKRRGGISAASHASRPRPGYSFNTAYSLCGEVIQECNHVDR
ncbi:95982d30-55b6-4b04-ad5f-69d06191ce9a, partial [Thermothielavioides terrestris]